MTEKNQNISHMAAAALFSVTLAGCAADSGSAPAAAPGPQGTPGSAQGCKADKLEDSALIGKTESEATGLLAGCRWRIGERDGEQFMGTMDYWEDRRTLGIAKGKVTWVKRG
ncbi:hypothetical protein [Collimonas fungivorans]|nr:hypothetical protein [Collimonas fungivorans]ACF93783.1 hypothetical protein [Collimonas fungivorans Ter331]